MRVPADTGQVQLLELKVELRRVERNLSQHVTPQADERVRIVVLPQPDSFGVGKLRRAEAHWPRGRRRIRRHRSPPKGVPYVTIRQRVRRPRGDHAGVARCSAIELPPSTTRYCP